MKFIVSLSIFSLLFLGSCQQLYRSIPKAKNHHKRGELVEKPEVQSTVKTGLKRSFTNDIQLSPLNEATSNAVQHYDQALLEAEKIDPIQDDSLTQIPISELDSIHEAELMQYEAHKIIKQLKAGNVLTGVGSVFFFPFLYIMGIVVFIMGMRKFRKLPQVSEGDLYQVEKQRRIFSVVILTPLLWVLLILLLLLLIFL